MGLGDWFNIFCDNLQVRNGATVRERYSRITRRLNTDFWTTTSDTAHSLYAGSYGRNTATHGASDVDMIFQLPYSEYTRYNDYTFNGQSALLQAVKSSIEKTYPVTRVRADGQVIQVPFDDGITFEVVPAFENKDSSFTFPDANVGGSWRTTNPRAEIKAIRDRNTVVNGNLVPLCRMMRDWKVKWSVPMGGLLIDTLAYQFIETWQFHDKSYLYYDFMCRDFFLWMSRQDDAQEWWRAPGSCQWVWGKGIFQYKAKRCYNLACEAIAHETAPVKREWSAKKMWREIFTTNFPD